MACIAQNALKNKKSTLIITENITKVEAIQTNLQAYLNEDKVVIFPALSNLPFNYYDFNSEALASRINTLARLANGEKLIVVADASGLARKIPSPNEIKNACIRLKLNEDVNIDSLVANLLENGYSREYRVNYNGEFSLRGDILDVFPADEENPVRIEFFGSEVEKIKCFDVETQLTIGEELKELRLIPQEEILQKIKNLQANLPNIENEINKTLTALAGQPKKNFMDKFNPLVEKIRQGIWQEDMASFAFYMLENNGNTLLNYFNNDIEVITDEIADLELNLLNQEEKRNELYYEFLEQGTVLPSFAVGFWEVAEIFNSLANFKQINLLEFSVNSQKLAVNSTELNTSALNNYLGNVDILRQDVKNWQSLDVNIIFTASTQMRCNRIKNLLEDYEIKGCEVVNCGINEGFGIEKEKIIIFSEKEILGQEKKNKKRRKVNKGKTIENFVDLKVGDYVVHINHGIGQYMGMERVKTSEFTRDYLFLQYGDGDKLYVPVDQMDMVQKYIGNNSDNPRIHSLGGVSWAKAKAKARKSVAIMTDQLIKLYAARESVKGFAYSEDSLWQKEFEDAFLYNETPDQLKAIEEIKADMERPRPMDRLLCGDVGYGKTEVAMRAAFKAVQDGKQVAVLVPTTILAEQHRRTFTERMANYPVKIAMLSRFVKPKAQRQVEEGLVNGQVDILIGTHKLLSKNIQYHDLGLLIVDEEQRFGVAHKEKIKEMKNAIDVLTLSATPIPRTLHMSMVGMRDMSIINTPPEDRHPVSTYIMEFNQKIIVDAINSEVRRGGQVFFVHNRVEDIANIASMLALMLPDVKIDIAHGQMSERELEPKMSAFIEGETDVLVCTTIAESGLDITNANTLIVNNADFFGLSQLYQLRGRVGRSNRQAYAYFTYQSGKLLTDVARSRLKAISDFTSLGSGFKIAMRDMEIRGAGNVLGGEQHGQIASIGFDLYCRLVQDAISQSRGEEVDETREISVNLDLGVNAYIPDSYISDSETKLEVYKNIGEITKISELNVIMLELKDRFGKVPEPVRNLILFSGIKVLSKRLGVISINNNIRGYFVSIKQTEPLTPLTMQGLSARYPKRIYYKQTKNFVIDYRVTKEEKERYGIRIVMDFLLSLEKIKKEDGNSSKNI